MKLQKALHRDRERNRRTKGVVIDGRSVLLLEEILRKKAEKAERKLERRLHKEVEEQPNDGEES